MISTPHRRQPPANVDESIASTAVDAVLPLPLPSRFPRPSTGFLRNEPPYQESFAAALRTSYLGFVVDEQVTPNERTLQTALCTELVHHFRTDVTQPFGLGTGCATTYVTRCLVGDGGTTYKYLGLRMFAHAWPTAIHDLSRTLSNRVDAVHLPQLQRDRDDDDERDANTDAQAGTTTTTTTTTRTGRPSRQRHHRGNNGSTDQKTFDVCLINRMTARHPHLKVDALDPSFRTTVSWHADSSLEHYSTIAVYQTLMRETDVSSSMSSSKSLAASSPTPPDTATHWSVALRVSPHAEGPGSTSLKRSDAKHDAKATEQTTPHSADAPPIAISLPSNSAYYLLDDFNHHHQHTVLTSKTAATKSQSKTKTFKRSQPTTPTENGSDDWIRYSLTFRLLRESHNVEHMLQRCERTIKSFHKRKTTKLVRSQQLLLTELETEWLRQFYIQGSHHATLLWPSWCRSMQQLWQYWTRLEERTLQVIVWLQHAAQGQCYSSVTAAAQVESTSTPVSVASCCKTERKLRDKRRKAATALQELLDRESKDHRQPHIQRVVEDGHDSGDDNVGANSIFEELASLLDTRATMRELWIRRESDPAFRDLQSDHQPIPFPARFQRANHKSVDVANESSLEAKNRVDGEHQHGFGVSPMPGTASELRKLANHIRAFERAFQSGSSQDLPRDEALFLNELIAEEVALVGPAINGVSSKGEVPIPNSMPMGWSGWDDKSLNFGLEMQCPWAEAILNGSKSIETRRYKLPTGLVGRRLAILRSPLGKVGESALGNNISLSENSHASVVGWCRFSAVIMYDSRHAFCADEQRHGVIASSGFGWNDDTKVIYGWVVEEYGRVDHDTYHSGTRRFRSIFELHPIERNHTNKQTPSVRRTKKPAKGGRSPDINGQIKKKRRF